MPTRGGSRGSSRAPATRPRRRPRGSGHAVGASSTPSAAASPNASTRGDATSPGGSHGTAPHAQAALKADAPAASSSMRGSGPFRVDTDAQRFVRENRDGTHVRGQGDSSGGSGGAGRSKRPSSASLRGSLRGQLRVEAGRRGERVQVRRQSSAGEYNEECSAEGGEKTKEEDEQRPVGPGKKRDREEKRMDEEEVVARLAGEREEKKKAEEQAEAARAAEADEAARIAETARARAVEVRRRRWEERGRNLRLVDGNRPTESELRRLESSLKKCTGFLRRIRGVGVTEESIHILLTEGCGLNLSRYISEVVSAVADTKVKASDIEHAARLCGEFHRRYADFAPLLVPALIAIMTASQREVAARRSAVRLLVELVAVDITRDVAMLIAPMKEILRSGRDTSDTGLANMAVVAAFAKAGSNVFLLSKRPRDPPLAGANTLCAEVGSPQKGPCSSPSSRKSSNDTVCDSHCDAESTGMRQGQQTDTSMPEDWEDDVVPHDLRLAMAMSMQAYARDICSLLEEVENELREYDLAVYTARTTRGVEDTSATISTAAARRVQERVYSVAVAVCESLGQVAPLPYQFKPDIGLPESEGKIGGSLVVVGAFGGGVRDKNPGAVTTASTKDPGRGPSGTGTEQLFDSEEERSFYRDLVNLSGDRTNAFISQASAKASDDIPLVLSSGPVRSVSGRGTTGFAGASDVGASAPLLKSEVPAVPTLESLLSRLSIAETSRFPDTFVWQLLRVCESNRSAPKKLTRHLLNVPSHLLHVLPAYARIAACLRAKLPEVATTVACGLEDDLRLLISRTDHDEKSVACYVKVARYVGEYVKFELIPPTVFFDMLGLCLKDFTGHKVEVCCHLVETCGRFLCRLPQTGMRAGNFLDTIWRLKSVKNLEARLNALVEAAYFASRPRSTNRIQRKRLDPVREYVRWRICSQLSMTNVERTALQLRKLPWNEDVEMFVVWTFVQVQQMRFSQLRSCARLLAFISRDRSSVGVAVCDGLLESIRVGMRANDGRDSQRRLAEVVLLGEIFNTGLLNPPVMFQVLYEIISFGFENPRGFSSSSTEGSKFTFGSTAATEAYENSTLQSDLVERSLPEVTDPPNDFFRARLVCALLTTCGSRLASPSPSRKSSARRQIEVFWAYFERYIFTKAAIADETNRLPLHVEHMIADTFELVRIVLQDDVIIESPVGSTAKGDGESTSRVSRGRRQNIKPLSQALKGRLGLHPYAREAGTAEANPEATGEWFVRSETYEQVAETISCIEGDKSLRDLVAMPERKYVVQSEKAALATSTPGTVSREGDEPAEFGTGAEEDESDATSESSDGTREDDDEFSLDRLQLQDDGKFSDADSEEDDSRMIGSSELIKGPGRDSDCSNRDIDSDDRDDVDAEDDEDVGGEEEGPEEDEEEDDLDEDEDDYYVEVSSSSAARTEEEDLFEQELASVTAGEVATAKMSFTGHLALDRMAIPLGLMAKRNESSRAAAATAAVFGDCSDRSGIHSPAENLGTTGAGAGAGAGAVASGPHSCNEDMSTLSSARRSGPPGDTVSFRLLVRRGGKSQLRTLEVPSASAIAVATKESETQDARHQAELRKLVLESTTVLNAENEAGFSGEENMMFDPTPVSRKARNIQEQRAEDEQAVISTLSRSRPRG